MADDCKDSTRQPERLHSPFRIVPPSGESTLSFRHQQQRGRIPVDTGLCSRSHRRLYRNNDIDQGRRERTRGQEDGILPRLQENLCQIWNRQQGSRVGERRDTHPGLEDQSAAVTSDSSRRLRAVGGKGKLCIIQKRVAIMQP